MKYFFGILILLHGAIHYLGFAKAFDLFKVEQLRLTISKSYGILWALSFMLLGVSGGMILANRPEWWMLSVVAVLLSQLLIVKFWKDAKYGTIANVIIIIPAIVGWNAWQFERDYEVDVSNSIERMASFDLNPEETLDASHLPILVQRYLDFTGMIDSPQLLNFKIQLEGQMRNAEGDWFDFSSEQFNFFDQPERFFFMKATVSGLPVYGYHVYKEGEASMLIKALSIFPIIDNQSDELSRAEMVTVLNDMCVLAPSTLIDPRLSWQVIDSTSVNVTFTHGQRSVAAVLEFDSTGKLTNFTSDDRFEINEKRRYRFSTPIYSYQTIDDIRIPLYAETIWHYDDGPFVYGRFNICNISYNVVP